jgi:hypothetical protein
LKHQSESTCLSTKEHYVQDKRSSRRESFITGSWCQSSGRRYLDPQATPTSITNLTNFIGNQSKQPRELGFMANSIRQRRSLKAHRDLQDSPGEPGCHLPRINEWASCLPQMAPTSRLSATLNCGLFTSPSGMSRSTLVCYQKETL